jgi:alkylation response protein AidB-like acyl-CoA dehydrogenase
VDVGFSDSQLELRSAVREVLERECPPSVAREALSDPERWRPLWKTVTDLGWTGLALLDDEAGYGVIELIAVLEEVGAAAAPIPLLSSAGFAAGVLRAAGPDAAPWQERLAEGAVGVLGVAAPVARGFDPSLSYADGRVQGVVGGVADADRAELLVLLARGPAGGAVATVVRPGDGVTVTTADAVDPGRSVATLTVDAPVECALPIELPAALSLPLTAAAAELVGLAGRALDVAVTHARTREQFGKPIGAFQGMKHPLADCYVAIERARGLTYAAAMQLTDPDAAPADTWRAALLAKAAAGEAATETTRIGVRVHGALGMTWEHDMHLYLRRAWGSATTLGDQRTLYRLAAASAVGRS